MKRLCCVPLNNIFFYQKPKIKTQNTWTCPPPPVPARDTSLLKISFLSPTPPNLTSACHYGDLDLAPTVARQQRQEACLFDDVSVFVCVCMCAPGFYFIVHPVQTMIHKPSGFLPLSKSVSTVNGIIIFIGAFSTWSQRPRDISLMPPPNTFGLQSTAVASVCILAACNSDANKIQQEQKLT